MVKQEIIWRDNMAIKRIVTMVLEPDSDISDQDLAGSILLNTETIGSTVVLSVTVSDLKGNELVKKEWNKPYVIRK